MSEQSTRAAVTNLYAAYARGDGARMAALIDDDVDFVIYGPLQVFPFAGHHRGKGAVLEAHGRLVEFREFMNTFEVVQQVLDRQLAV